MVRSPKSSSCVSHKSRSKQTNKHEHRNVDGRKRADGRACDRASLGNIILGKRASLEALKSATPLERVVVVDVADLDDRQIVDIFALADERDIEVATIDSDEFERKYGDGIHSHQGVAVVAKPFDYAPLERIIERAEASYESDMRSLVVICDHITDAGNLGAIIRSAESVGAAGIVIPNRRSAQVTSATYKTSAGAISHISIAQVPNLARSIVQLKENGFWVIGATEKADDLVWDTDLKGRIALVVGNEHSGISELVLKNCDLYSSLPQVGEVSSLNVAQASTVFMYEWLRQNLS